MFALAAMLAGCTYLPADAPGANEPPGYIELMDNAARADSERLATMRDEARQRFRQNATSENQLRLALILSAPASTFEDAAKSASLLAQLAASPNTGDPTQQQLARARLKDVEARLALHSNNADKQKSLDDLRRQLDEANAKIEELLNIEQSMENGRWREEGEDSKQ